eukprot:GHVS01052227.1.p1 GENE.GHVS01052227.1~~GHVS01052227.1.p1  ORF type:complete len:183 (+),score=11.86 GHVS01052227.1:115-663(+)
MSYYAFLSLSNVRLLSLTYSPSPPVLSTSIPTSVTHRLATARRCSAFTTSERSRLRLSDSLSLRQEGSAAFVGCPTFRADRYVSTLYDLPTARPLPPFPYPVDAPFTDRSLPFFPKENSDAFDGQETVVFSHSDDPNSHLTKHPFGRPDRSVNYANTYWWRNCAVQPTASIHTHPFLRRSPV